MEGEVLQLKCTQIKMVGVSCLICSRPLVKKTPFTVAAGSNRWGRSIYAVTQVVSGSNGTTIAPGKFVNQLTNLRLIKNESGSKRLK